MNILSSIVTYFREVKEELEKVTWPTKQETIKYTIAVVIFSSAMVIFLGGLDMLFSYLLNNYIL